MSIDARKIGMACFVGGAVCAGALLFLYLSGSHPWLYGAGVLAGFLAGYLTYEFGEVMAAIPIAVRVAARVAKSTCWEFAEWFVQPHPFFHQAMVLGLLMSLFYVREFLLIHPSTSLAEKILLLPTFSLMIIMLVTFALYPLASLGAQRCEQCYWDTSFYGDPLLESKEQKLLNKKYKKVPLTYQNALRWEAKGVGFIIWHPFSFFLYDLWKWVGMAVVYGVKFVVLFFWHLFKLIHSNKRLLCGVYSALGGMVTFLGSQHWHIPSSPVEYSVLMLTGGCMGAFLGVLNWKLVSVKLFDMPEYNPI